MASLHFIPWTPEPNKGDSIDRKNYENKNGDFWLKGLEGIKGSPDQPPPGPPARVSEEC